MSARQVRPGFWELARPGVQNSKGGGQLSSRLPPLALLLSAGHTHYLASKHRGLLRLGVVLRSPSINKPADDLGQSSACLAAFDDRADARSQLVHRKGLAQHMHPRLQAPVRDRSVLRIAGNEEDVQVWSADAGGVGHLLAIHAARQPIVRYQ